MGCDIHVYMERRLGGHWVAVNAPLHEGEIDYGKPYPWGAWTYEVSPLEELSQLTLPFAERFPTKAEEWAFGRNYDSFGRLSGVRGDNEYRPANGMPKDASASVRQSWKEGGDDWHNPTHWTLGDLDEAHENREPDPQEYGVARISALLSEMKRVAMEYNLMPDSVRVVFWFDN